MVLESAVLPSLTRLNRYPGAAPIGAKLFQGLPIRVFTDYIAKRCKDH